MSADFRLTLLVPIKPRANAVEYLRIAERFEETDTIRCVYGLDDDDDLGRHALADRDIATVKAESPFPMCRLWTNMAAVAFENKTTMVLLVGDDVRVFDRHAMVNEIRELYELGGYECISVCETNHPGWPAFLASTSRFYPLPAVFVNQDADPYLFEKARREKCAAVTRHTHLINETGGVEGGLMPFSPPRYLRRHAELRHLMPSFTAGAFLTLDIVVPMYRPSVEFVKSLLELEYDIERMAVRVCVCLDVGRSAVSEEDWHAFRQLECKEPRLRVRVNETNDGLGYTYAAAARVSLGIRAFHRRRRSA
jgi:hypothetical protein